MTTRTARVALVAANRPVWHKHLGIGDVDFGQVGWV